MTTYEIGDQVQAGEGEDYDIGEIADWVSEDPDDDRAEIRWSGGNVTTESLSNVSHMPECARCGSRRRVLDTPLRCSRCGLAETNASER